MALALTNYEIEPYLEKRKQEKEGEEGEKGKEEEKDKNEETKKKEAELSKDITLLGSMLFSRQCSGSLLFVYLPSHFPFYLLTSSLPLVSP